MTAASDAVPSTPMELVSRLTEQLVTPGTFFTAFSTRAEQAAQLMPVTLNCSIKYHSCVQYACKRSFLFHELGQKLYQFVQLFLAARAQVVRDAGGDVLCQQLFGKTVQRRLNR